METHIEKVESYLGKKSPITKEILKSIPQKDESLLIFRDWEFVLFYYSLFKNFAEQDCEGTLSVRFHPLNNAITSASYMTGCGLQIFHISQTFPLFSWIFNAIDAKRIKSFFEESFPLNQLPRKKSLIIFKLENTNTNSEHILEKLLGYPDTRGKNLFIYQPKEDLYLANYIELRKIFPKDIIKIILSFKCSEFISIIGERVHVGGGRVYCKTVARELLFSERIFKFEKELLSLEAKNDNPIFLHYFPETEIRGESIIPLPKRSVDQKPFFLSPESLKKKKKL